MCFFLLFKNKRNKQPETAAALKRTIEALMDRGAVVRNLENLGERALPYRISAHSQRHTRGGPGEQCHARAQCILRGRAGCRQQAQGAPDCASPSAQPRHPLRHWHSSWYFLVDFYSPTTTVESMMEHLSRDIDVIRRNIVRHPLTQEVKACEGIVPVPLEEKLYSTKKRK
uniref:Small ribosomal subunit protein bS6m n=1 Tax=Pipistrellus kuhlii TaxID=59472 RepID=A0A7J7R2A1_PIPKU|nr:mitochondrial ribosomal protein S6 [Pipistrellus kuhlii]